MEFEPKKCVLDAFQLVYFQRKVREAHLGKKRLSNVLCQFAPLRPSWIARVRAISKLEVAQHEAEETQAEEAQHTAFAVLAEPSKAKATLQGFEEGLNVPATFPSALDHLGRAWHGRDDEAPFLVWQAATPRSPRVTPREDREAPSSGRTS
ncbi:hypothetical protein MF271_00820 (plasmid) [Deinococcus sp. KNUC1210]|nr:hypothetical protein [Deinococcus sp. KNUC1210]ULH14054.1 hypothetical protein MF271_00820 [Deinococcus sp. KNUC1210]